jgi:hypothetical protein
MTITENNWCARLIAAAIMLLLLAFAVLAPYLFETINHSIYFFFTGICHQHASSCFDIFGHPMAICVRCTGIYFGIAFGALWLPLLSYANRKHYLRALLASG